MIVLGIETSCDETSVAIVDKNNVLINIVASQILHREYGGVVPEFASREHIRLIEVIARDAINGAIKDINRVDGIAATYGPGLMGALLVGLSFAKGIACTLNKSFIAVNHIEAHIMVNFLSCYDLKYPFMCLLVSGGHTMLIYVEEFRKYKLIGRSVDDAVGEAFDKGSRILGLGYPGGPIIDKLAASGIKDFYPFPRAKLKSSEFDFSFSGIKTSLLYLVKKKGMNWVKTNINHICASYQEAIIEMLLTNTIKAIEFTGVDKLVLAGGVAANSRLREMFNTELKNRGMKLYYPPLEYCTDNAAMIAYTGYEMLKRGYTSPLNISPFPNLKLGI